MMTRKLLAGAAFFLVGIGATSANAQVLNLKGSDTLEDITKDAITAAGLNASLVYIGGGSSSGQNALIASPPTQQIAPMSRQLNGTACTTLGATIGQELIGLDGLAVVGANQVGGDSDAQSATTADDCNDNITGGVVLNVPGCTANDGCDASSNYTFADWKDVLAMVYGGQNHNAGALLISGARNPVRINCNSIVRRALVDNWGSLFQTGTGPQSCRTGTCTKLRHAFRRDDLSGTTDTFVTLVGMAAIPGNTTAADGSPTFLPKPDAAAAANPFCNAGDAKMNKGDSDYLDLDPIRRAVDHVVTGRVPLEQVAQAGLPAFGGNNSDANCAFAGAIPPTDSSSSSVPNLLPSQVIAGSQARLQQELGFPAGGSAALNPFTRVCLGLVLPIAMPSNYTTQDAYFGASGATPPVPCSIDPVTGTPVMVNKILDTVFPGSLCTDGKTQPCRVPVNNSTGTNNFNCYLDTLNPAILPLRDNRGFHLHPVTNAGVYRRDSYVNPAIPVALTNGNACVANSECGNGTCTANVCTGDTRPTIPAARQNRVVTAFYRLHFSRSTNLNGSVPTLPAGQGCQTLSATNQIGCLVKANACSIGFAGREAVDVFSPGPPRNFAFQVAGVAPSVANVQNLFTGGTPVYPISRGLYVNAVKGFANVTAGAEANLLTFFRTPASIDPIVTGRNFIQVPASVTRSSGCPRP